MANWFDMNAMQMSRMMSEDVCAPELRNPKYTALRQRRSSWLLRALRLG